MPTATKFIKLNQKEVCNCLMDNKAQKSFASNCDWTEFIEASYVLKI